MIETIKHLGITYPKFQSSGNAARFIIPFAQEVCKGRGFDIGYGNPEWKFPGAIGIEQSRECSIHGVEWPNMVRDAYHLPESEGKVDYIFSSHNIEHLPNWSDALDYWYTVLKPGGTLFLYLPNMDQQKYWRAWHNKKHIHYLNPQILNAYMMDMCMDDKYSEVFISETDLNGSFCVMAEKALSL